MLRGFSLEAMLKGDGLKEQQSHDGGCQCGCVPNILSLHEQAKERARRRKEKEAAAQRPTISEYLQQHQGEVLVPTPPPSTTSSTVNNALLSAIVAPDQKAPEQKPP